MAESGKDNMQSSSCQVHTSVPNFSVQWHHGASELQAILDFLSKESFDAFYSEFHNAYTKQ